MKTFIKTGIFVTLAILIGGCAQKPVKTIENLKYAFNGESTASAKYAAFAEKATSEGLDTIAVMFMATSKAEAIHAENHKKVLEKLGEKIEGPELGKFEVLTTKENLSDAHKGETGEIESMYPGFIETANGEKAADAVKSFTWALDTEKKHQEFYQKALDALDAGGETTLPAKWFVCPVCGNTFADGNVSSACDFCMTPQDKFIAF
jgi:rubrerythrin